VSERTSVRRMAKIALALQALCLVAGLGLASFLLSATDSLGWAFVPVLVFGGLGASTMFLTRCPSCDVPVPNALLRSRCPRCGEPLDPTDPVDPTDP
jgi:hypothetical protein